MALKLFCLKYFFSTALVINIIYFLQNKRGEIKSDGEYECVPVSINGRVKEIIIPNRIEIDDANNAN